MTLGGKKKHHLKRTRGTFEAMCLFVLFLSNIGDDQHHSWVNVQLEPEAGYLSIKTGKRPVNKNAIHKSH